VDPNKIEIDYDRVDVARIMDQIKEKMAAESAKRAGCARDAAARPSGSGIPGWIRADEAGSPEADVPPQAAHQAPHPPRRRGIPADLLVLDHANRRIDRWKKNRDRMSGGARPAAGIHQAPPSPLPQPGSSS